LARFLVSTELLVDFLHRGASQALATIPVRDLAVSALSFALVLAEVEADRTLTPASRQQWRSNVLGFRQALRAQGGQITDVSERTLEKWGEIWNLQLFHVYSQAEGPVEMSSEERMVVATALTNGLIYLTPDRDWNAEIEDKLQVAFQVA
jgi:hypothetical protein